MIHANPIGMARHIPTTCAVLYSKSRSVYGTRWSRADQMRRLCVLRLMSREHFFIVERHALRVRDENEHYILGETVRVRVMFERERKRTV